MFLLVVVTLVGYCHGPLPALTLRTTIQERGVAFVLSSYPPGKFDPLNPNWTTCEPSAETLVGSLAQDSTFRFTAPKIRNESLLFS
ncbi:hypothetical protein TNIN_371041 [Trichonephila inaurata madagascariensis]|uniref:Uncharacterized protein n=1 Tax=Trichonephila inaurata madagascariensis TaxID=2747483 RepID=A0A8X6MGE7_9ARAC|nr:hypothetical protein TNIN_371041 [Trichonephila inaurata madagascariensis]